MRGQEGIGGAFRPASGGWALTSSSPLRQPSTGERSQPDGEVFGSREIEQGISQGFQLLQQHSQGLAQLEPVAGGVCEEESALSSKASILDSSAASRSFSFFSSFKRFSLSCIRFSLAIKFSSCCFVRCSMS